MPTPSRSPIPRRARTRSALATRLALGLGVAWLVAGLPLGQAAEPASGNPGDGGDGGDGLTLAPEDLTEGATLDMSKDPHLWLEDVTGDEALDWVRARNAEAKADLVDDDFTDLTERLRAIYDADDRIPYVSARGEWLYNLWRDAEHPIGLWRRTTLDAYRTDDPAWETVLDLDALAAEEDENWVWKGATCLAPAYDRCLLALSRGGADATVLREFDLTTRSFVEGGFEVPEAKSRVSWIDRDTLFVATALQGGDTVTESGYPRQVHIWRRGTPWSEAELVYEGETTDVSVGAYHDTTPGYERSFVYRSPTFYTNQMWELTRKGLQPLDKPDSASASIHRDWIYLELRDDWERDGTTYKAGSLLAAPYKRFRKGKGALTVLFEPTERSSLAGFTPTRDHVLLNVLEDVRNTLTVLTPAKKGPWEARPLAGAPTLGSVSAWAYDADESDAVWLQVSGYLTPSSLALTDLSDPTATPETLKTLPARFDAEGLEVSQHFATSADGTRVPYFEVKPADAPMDGSTPTLLYGYGGFEVSLTPGYSGGVGAGWLERGGAYVVANIRGGGEYGPRWHQAALKDKRHKAYEDFIAVGEDLIARGVTSTPKLGIMGGSNGGLLMGNMYALRPDLWGAIVCRVPLLDMRRYHTLLAGASWMGEYGDPDDPEQWAFIQTFSPYHMVRDDVDYPPMLLTTSTRDDRVHPGHARKMAARMLTMEQPVLYYENIEGGHGGAANNEQRAFMSALAFGFLWDRLHDDGEASEEAPADDTAPDGSRED